MSRARPFVVATRIHATHMHNGEPGLDLAGWCERVGGPLVIAADSASYARVCTEVAGVPGVEVLHVSPWQGYTQPLNVLVNHAARIGVGHIMFRSIEVELPTEAMHRLYERAGLDTLVVGAKLDPAHGGAPGEKSIDGRTSPWNTLALWNVDKLALTGFLAVADGLHPGGARGVEEVTTISLLQWMRPYDMRAFLVDAPGLHWDQGFPATPRRIAHQFKMTSKLSRGQAQLDILRIPPGQVTVS